MQNKAKKNTQGIYKKEGTQDTGHNKRKKQNEKGIKEKKKGKKTSGWAGMAGGVLRESERELRLLNVFRHADLYILQKAVQ